MSPEDYRGIVAQVPFVDVVTTMLDESIPLTTNEYDEWGNPNDAQVLRLPAVLFAVRQRARAAYPAMLVTTGLWDSQVQYYEPAKWVAKLRALKTDSQSRCCCTSRWRPATAANRALPALSEIAMEYAFMLGARHHRVSCRAARVAWKKKAPRAGKLESRRLSSNQRGERKNNQTIDINLDTQRQ
jgi:oligopeptidase B